MTGLDPSGHVIVEIAALITDDDLEIVAEGPDLVVVQPPRGAGRHARHRQAHARAQRADQRGAGVDRVAGRAPAQQVLAFLKEHAPEPGTVPLCGNSIGTDRRFLAAYLPEINDHLHYRSVDVSTVKELCRRWYPEAYAAAPVKAGSHRALDDIKESVAELRYYRDADLPARRPRTPTPSLS